jgi:RNA polymerase sigma-54 factor
MAIEARLSLRQSQRLVMTPLLQQAIHLLQLSTLELQEELQRELTENPLLEEVNPDDPDAGYDPGADAALTALAAEPMLPQTVSVDSDRSEELPFDLASVVFDEPEERSLVQQEEREEFPFDQLVRSSATLSDHLLEQLRLATEEPAARLIGEAIIGNLDEDGYLRADLAEIAELTGSTTESVETVLSLVQAFDPTGIAARTPQECLLLQLRADPQPDPVAVEIVQEHFDDLERRRYAEIARALKVSPDRVMEAVEEIQALEPKPGRKFATVDTRYVVPDAFVHKLENGYRVVLNEDGIPRLRVNSLYRRLLRGAGGEAKQYVEQKVRSALWFIKSIQQRQRTLLRVTESIVKFQLEFLDRGLSFLRPLALRDVAVDIGMHESTVSRVTTNKYVQTPQGLFELKFFFHSGITSGNGNMVSSVSVKKMLRDLIVQEPLDKPLSDQELAQVLKGRGLTIARRTVAKYREELGILPSHQRRLVPKKR